MKVFLKKIHMPVVGLMLAFAALGNLVQSYGDVYRNIMGAISAILFIVATVKFVYDFQGLKNELDNPIGASVFQTYSMGIMLLATYVKPYNGSVAYAVWIVGILINIALMIRFSMKFIRKFNIKQVLPSWFIVYVGIAVAAVTGKAFNQTVGQYAFWFAVVSYLILIFVVGKRVFVVKEIPEPALPTLVIFSAPGSLCLAGYLNAFDQKNLFIFWLLLVLSQCFYIFALIKLVGLLKLKFYPSYSGFTFPLVISALALKLSNGFLINQGVKIAILPVLIKVEDIIAVIIVFYVLIRYLGDLAKNKSN
ncbi:TDT family transporter [Clostridium gasigenes]|uniref:TDT family transporter n=1 Tax=Clostridium gasigenes TaxID=94869 RepID=UPI001C0BDF57|nr:TDT family transporter [Clostridium gasigenes]